MPGQQCSRCTAGPGSLIFSAQCGAGQTDPEVGKVVKFTGSLRPDMGCQVPHDSPADRTWRGLRSPKKWGQGESSTTEGSLLGQRRVSTTEGSVLEGRGKI